MTLSATYGGANGWLLEFGEPRFTGSPLRVLVDPWLEGPLVFPPGPWLLKGELKDPLPVPESVDVLLLTQSLADHATPPAWRCCPVSCRWWDQPRQPPTCAGWGFSGSPS